MSRASRSSSCSRLRFPLPLLGALLALLPPLPLAAGPELRQRVARAIDRGRAHLYPWLAKLRSEPREDYPAGRLALPLAALLKAGVAADDAEVEAAFAALEGLPLRKTYSVACHLFALDALWQRRFHEHASVPGGARLARRAEGETRERMERLVRWLVEARVEGRGGWGYEPAADSAGARFDFSNTQFAVLGLYVGLEHGVAVPAAVFDEIAVLFTRSLQREGQPFAFELRAAPGLEAALGVARAPPAVRHLEVPGGWGYRPRSSRPPPRHEEGPGEAGGNDPYPSMTAAGVSSLAIALEALRHPALARAGGRAAGARDAGKALLSGYAWIVRYFDHFLADGRNLPYTLYSLEKAGDLGRVEELGGRAWYGEGAEKLLALQGAGGGFGSYIDTSFALLFLTRASRGLEAATAPAILTRGEGSGGAEAGDERGDLVYIERAGGFLSARKLLAYLGDTRRAELVPLGEEVVRHYPSDRRAELVPLLLDLWGKPDAITRFSRKALSGLTGVDGERSVYEEWWRELEAIAALEGEADLGADAVAARLRGLASVELRRRLVELAARRGLRALAPVLIEELASPSIEYLRVLHGVLLLWTDAPVSPPSKDDAAGWRSTTEAWQRWWQNEGRARHGPGAGPGER
jgi:hypothetical protein